MRTTESEFEYIKNKIQRFTDKSLDWKEDMLEETYINNNLLTLETLIKRLKGYNRRFNDKVE